MFEEFGVLFRGLVLGLIIAAPVGPVGLLCIRRTVQRGLLIGFATGFGAAFADAFFSAVAVFGVAFILDFVRAHKDIIHMVGGAFLLVVAWVTWHDAPHRSKRQHEDNGVGGAVKAWFSGFVITLSNPVTVFAILAVVATFGGMRNRLEATTLVAGIFMGSALWWIMLSGGIALVRQRFTEAHVVWINRVTAVALAVLALWAFGSGVMKLTGKL